MGEVAVITVRPMRPDDEPLVRGLSDTIYGGMDRPDDFHRTNSTLVAEVDGAVVGYASYAFKGRVVMLLESAVMPKYRGRGIGRALMQARLDVARERGFAALGAVRDGNAPMIHLLTACGFRPLERVEGEMLYLLEAR